MKRLLPLHPALLISLAVPLSWGGVVFEDGFDDGELGPSWTEVSTAQGRARVTEEFSPAEGTHHLVLDDSVTDALFSTAAVTLTVNLTNMKEAVLTFKAKSIGNEPHPPPAGIFTSDHAYDGVAVSANGGQSWIAAVSLANVGLSWEEVTVSLDSVYAALEATYAGPTLIRFSAHDNAEAPSDGIAIDRVSVTAVVDQRTALEMPTSLAEGTVGHEGMVLVAIPPSEPLTLTLTTTPPGQLTVPQSIVVPAGATSALFTFDVADDDLINPMRVVSVSAVGPGVTPAPVSVTITDNDVVSASLELPDRVTEGEPASVGVLVLSHTTTIPIEFALSATPPGEITLPPSVTVQPGAKQAAFNIGAVNDNRLDGDVTATVTAESPGIAPATATVVAADNEPRTLTLVVPATLTEGSTGPGTISVAGILSSPLTITLTSSDPAVVSVPAEVTINAGQIGTGFTVTAVDNDVVDPERPPLTITATADTFEPATQPIQVADNDPSAIRIDPLPEMVNISAPVPLAIRATNAAGASISGHSGTVTLTLVRPNGSTQALTPGTVTFTNSVWTGTVSIPSIAEVPLRIRAVTSRGLQAESTPFDILRIVPLNSADLAWDAGRERLYVSQPSAGDNRVIALNPIDLTTVASLPLTNGPERLALTDDGAFLYCHRRTNGTVAKIKLDTMTLDSSFAVGTDPSYGPLYVADMCTVAGQPNLLIISQRRASVSPEHNGVVVYDNGVARPVKTRDHTGSNQIEPSSDPTIFFGQNTESSEFGFRRLRLTEDGITELDVTQVFSGFGLMMRSEGDRVYTNGGEVADGAQALRLGSFNTSGLPCPDRTTFRVYLLEYAGGHWSGSDRITAYDPVALTSVRSMAMPVAVQEPSSFIRWGATGLAFRSPSALYLINSAGLIPADAPADVAVSVIATPNPATTDSPVTYQITATNGGPNPAQNVRLSATFSEGQSLQSPVVPGYAPHVSGRTVSVDVGTLGVNATVVLTVPTLPQFAGTLSCVASSHASSIDPVTTNNQDSKLVSVGFSSTPNSVNDLRLAVNNLVADPVRNVLWATTPASTPAPLGKMLVAINPLNGLFSDPIALHASPQDNCMALSANGRYLYVGLNDNPEIYRFDLSVSPPNRTRISMAGNSWGGNTPHDIEVLEGDGRSFVVTDNYATVAVIDDTTRRPEILGVYTANRIERTARPDFFIGFDGTTSSFQTRRLVITPAGIAIDSSVSSLISGWNIDISGGADTVLSSTGTLANSATLTLISNLPSGGRPCLDAPNGRAYLVYNNGVRGYRTIDGSPTEILALPVTDSGDWAKSCVRWGRDGLAIAGPTQLLIARWSAIDQSGRDSDGNGFDDVWERKHFFALGVDANADTDNDGFTNSLEYLLLTNPRQPDVPHFTVSVSDDNPPRLRLVYERRSGLAPTALAYESSRNLTSWQPAVGVTENILSTGHRLGEPMESVEALIPWPSDSDHAYARIRWTGP